MINILDYAAEVEHEAHTPANKTDVLTSACMGVPESGGEESKTHGFSKTVAEMRRPNGEKVGWNAAILLRYLAIKVREHGRKIGGKTARSTQLPPVA